MLARQSQPTNRFRDMEGTPQGESSCDYHIGTIRRLIQGKSNVAVKLFGAEGDGRIDSCRASGGEQRGCKGAS